MFKKLAHKMAKEGMENPRAAAAAVGISKFGEKEMHKMAMAGKKRKEKERED